MSISLWRLSGSASKSLWFLGDISKPRQRPTHSTLPNGAAHNEASENGERDQSCLCLLGLYSAVSLLTAFQGLSKNRWRIKSRVATCGHRKTQSVIVPTLYTDDIVNVKGIRLLGMARNTVRSIRLGRSIYPAQYSSFTIHKALFIGKFAIGMQLASWLHWIYHIQCRMTKKKLVVSFLLFS